MQNLIRALGGSVSERSVFRSGHDPSVLGAAPPRPLLGTPCSPFPSAPPMLSLLLPLSLSSLLSLQ